MFINKSYVESTGFPPTIVVSHLSLEGAAIPATFVSDKKEGVDPVRKWHPAYLSEGKDTINITVAWTHILECVRVPHFSQKEKPQLKLQDNFKKKKKKTLQWQGHIFH